MSNPAFSLMSQVNPGRPMHRRRYRQLRNLNQNIEQRRTRFDARLRRETHKTGQQAMMPPTTESKKDKTEQPPMPSSGAARNAFRRGYMHGFMHIRKTDPHAPQSHIGWVKRRLTRELMDNPFMAQKDIESLVESLVAEMPSYEDQD